MRRSRPPGGPTTGGRRRVGDYGAAEKYADSAKSAIEKARKQT